VLALVPKQPKELSVAIIKSVGYGRRDLRKFSVNKPGFNYGDLKRSAGGGFRKFDHVEITKPDGKWRGIINCFDQTDKGKPRRLRVGYFDPDAKDPRKSGNTNQLRLIQKRDGYSYGSARATAEFPQMR